MNHTVKTFGDVVIFFGASFAVGGSYAWSIVYRQFLSNQERCAYDIRERTLAIKVRP